MRMIVNNIVDLAINSAIDRVNQTVPFAARRVLEKCRAADALACFCKSDAYGIVHAARHHWFHARAIRAAAKNVGGASHERFLSGTFIGLLGERPLAPVNPPVRPGVRPVKIVRATCERFAEHPLFALIGDAVAIGIGQFPNCCKYSVGRQKSVRAEPSRHMAPSGNIILSANTTLLSNLPSPVVLSRRTIRWGFFLS